MSKDQDGAKAKQLRGSLQEAIGKVTGKLAAQDDDARKASSRDQGVRKAQERVGKANDAVSKQQPG